MTEGRAYAYYFLFVHSQACATKLQHTLSGLPGRQGTCAQLCEHTVDELGVCRAHLLRALAQVLAIREDVRLDVWRAPLYNLENGRSARGGREADTSGIGTNTPAGRFATLFLFLPLLFLPALAPALPSSFSSSSSFNARAL